MVNAEMQPREALREVEARLTAAGCPDADFDAGELFRLVTGQDARLAARPLPAEQAATQAALTARRATFAAAGRAWILSWRWAPACSAPGPTRR